MAILAFHDILIDYNKMCTTHYRNIFINNQLERFCDALCYPNTVISHSIVVALLSHAISPSRLTNSYVYPGCLDPLSNS